MSERQLARHLSAYARVVFVDPQMSLTSILRNRALWPRLASRRLTRVGPNLLRLSAIGPPALTRPGARRVALVMQRRAMRRATRRSTPEVTALISAGLDHVFGACDERVSVLYGTDDFTAGAALMGMNPQWLAQQEPVQLARADLIVSVTETLAAKWRAMGFSVDVVPNGCDAELYSDIGSVPIASDIRLNGPIAGFVGHLSDRIDTACLEAVADTGISLLFVGPRQPTFDVSRIDALLRRPNVQWVGEKDPDMLPSYLRAMSVGLTPYVDSPFNRSSFPLKTLEYIAAGLHVVSTDLPSARTIPTEFISVASSPADFAAAAASAASASGDVDLVARRQRYAASQSWDARAREILRLTSRAIGSTGHGDGAASPAPLGHLKPSVLVLSMHDLETWARSEGTASAPGGTLPYGLDRLEADFALSWSDAQRRGLWGRRAPRAVGGAIRRAAPGLQGSLGAAYASRLQGGADVALSIFENAGLGYARAQTLRRGALRMPHVMMVCWLAEQIRSMSKSQVRSVRRSVQSVSMLTVFSRNQIPVLAEALDLPSERIRFIPFGVDTEYYGYREDHRARVEGVRIVAVGGDSERDYATLVRAMESVSAPLTLVCYPRNIEGLRMPGNVEVLSGIPHEQYRQLLRDADIVVTPTRGPEYPSGQSVVLEAMATGCATVTTDSAAMRDYVDDGRNGLLVPAGDADAMADALNGLISDRGRRDALGSTAARVVQAEFGLRNLWDAVAACLDEAARA